MKNLENRQELKILIMEAVREERNENNEKHDEGFLTREDVCRMFHISKTTLTKYCKKGLPYLRFGIRMLFTKDEIIAYLKQSNHE